jgi:hypothetical protein
MNDKLPPSLVTAAVSCVKLLERHRTAGYGPDFGRNQLAMWREVKRVASLIRDTEGKVGGGGEGKGG